jgi:bisphosphoglycerate-independent phosphoglycerate mutase (AlkP superfamily)
VFTAYYGVEYQPANIDRAISLIEMWRDDDWFIFLHLSSTDYAGHRSGAHSEGYRQAIVDLDTVLGRLMTAIGDAADAHVFIFGDHGMGAFDYPTGLAKPTKHDLSTPNALFVYSGDKERPRNVYTDQLVPTWLSLFGIAE